MVTIATLITTMAPLGHKPWNVWRDDTGKLRFWPKEKYLADKKKKEKKKETMVDPVLLDIKAIWGDEGVKKVSHGYQHDCPDCYGFGMWPGEFIPVHLNEAQEGWSTEECLTCGEDNAIFEFIRDRMEEKEARQNLLWIKTSDSIDAVLYEFEKGLRCVELSDIQGSNFQPHPW